MQPSIDGWINHVRYANTWGLRHNVIGDLQLRPHLADPLRRF